MKFYRYYYKVYGSSTDIFIPEVKILCGEFNLLKETPKGYWIIQGDINQLNSDKIWVSKSSVKRYAYPTKKEALINLLKRTEIRSKILRRNLNISEYIIKKTNKLIYNE